MRRRAASPALLYAAARRAARRSRWRRCSGCSRSRSCPPARRRRSRRACWPSAPTLEHYRALFTRLDLARALREQRAASPARRPRSRSSLNALAGYAFAKLRFPGRDRLFRALLAALVIPGQVGMLPLFLLLKEMGLVNSYLGVLVPGLASIFGIFLVRQYALGDPAERARRRARRRRRRAAHLVVDRAAALPADPRDPRDLHLHGHLERLPLAADRADRRGPPHAARRPREPARRARAGPRADDGGLGADRAAGRRALRAVPAPVHPGHRQPGACAGETRAALALLLLCGAAPAFGAPPARAPPTRRRTTTSRASPAPRRRAPTRAGCRASRATGRSSARPSTRRRPRSPRTAPSRSRRRPSRLEPFLYVEGDGEGRGPARQLARRARDAGARWRATCRSRASLWEAGGARAHGARLRGGPAGRLVALRELPRREPRSARRSAARSSSRCGRSR